MHTKVQVLVSFVVGVAVGVAGLWSWGQVQDIALRESPLDYVTVVSETEPITGDPDAMERRLRRESDADWGLRQLFIGIPGGPESLPQHAARLRERVNLPEGDRWRLSAALTNLLEGRPVARYGRLVVVWFQGSNNAEDWLLDDPAIFPDAAVEDARETWWAGTFVVYYSPEGAATDHTAAIDQWVRAIRVCPTHANPCDVPG